MDFEMLTEIVLSVEHLATSYIRANICCEKKID
jgi:hypothetical protein